MNRQAKLILLGTALLILGSFSSGCTNDQSRSTSTPIEIKSDRVIAQGQILPADGFIRLSSAPGDIVDHFADGVEIGEPVTAGQQLVVMRSAKLREKQMDALKAQLAAAEQKSEQAIAQANQRVRIAEAKKSSLQSKLNNLPRQKALISKAEEQVAASQQILSKLNALSSNTLTKEFIGELEIDRQRIELGEAELKVQQQRESFFQAEEDLKLALEAAEIELEVAREILAAAEQTSAVDVIQAQIETLKQEIASSQIIAPRDGTIVAINAQAGEAGIPQLPLIEMANLDELVVEAEINDRDAADVEPNQKATISSRAFKEELTGQVDQVFNMVGRPQLKQLDPLARADYRTKTATIKLNDSELARKWLQLQVTVEIQTGEKQTNETETDDSVSPES